MLLEIIACSMQDCQTIVSAKAHRVELCANMEEAGTTPPFELIKDARNFLDIPLHVMIRPRPGNFVYSPAEFDRMKQDITLCRSIRCDGVVLGILQTDRSVDVERTRVLVQLAAPMQVTFHRAFDAVRQMEDALEDVIETGCSRILTSGLAQDAMTGLSAIARLINLANNRICIMPGGGVRAENIAQIIHNTNCKEIHSSAAIHNDHLPNEAEIKRMLRLLK